MPRFVVLRHETPAGAERPSHFDFMLEDGLRLLTWASVAALDSPGPIALDELPDHRPAYLDYEGPVSRNRGEVQRVDAGSFDWLERTPDLVVVELRGARLAGRATLERVDPQPVWRWSFTPRESAR